MTTTANPLDPTTSRRVTIRLSKGKARSKDRADQKWCSVHKATSHSVEEYYTQGAPHPPQSGHAHIVFAVLGTRTRPADDDEKPTLNFNDDFNDGFAFTGLLLGSGQKGVFPQQRQVHDDCGQRRVGPLDRR